MTALHAARATGPVRRLQCRPIPSSPRSTPCAYQVYFGNVRSFAGAMFMDSDQHTSMASPASHVTSKYDLHPHPLHAHPTHLHATIPSNLPCLLHQIHPFGRKYFVDHCQCLATHALHHITTHHNISCFAHTDRICSHMCLLASPSRPGAGVLAKSGEK